MVTDSSYLLYKQIKDQITPHSTVSATNRKIWVTKIFFVVIRWKPNKIESVFQGQTPYEIAAEVKEGQYKEVMAYLQVRKVLKCKCYVKKQQSSCSQTF